jgi:hypothetical protein
MLFSIIAVVIYIARTVCSVLFSSHPCQNLLCHFHNSHSYWNEVISYCDLICFPWLLAMLSVFSYTCCPFVCLLLRYVDLGLLLIFKIRFVFFGFVFVLLLLSHLSSLYILNINPLSEALFANIFSHSISILITLMVVSIVEQKHFSFIKSYSFIFASVSCAVEVL